MAAMETLLRVCGLTNERKSGRNIQSTFIFLKPVTRLACYPRPYPKGVMKCRGTSELENGWFNLT